MLPLAQTTAPQLPPLPDGPALENVRGPLESASGYESWQIALAALALILIAGGFTWLYLRSRKTATDSLNPHAAARAEVDAAAQAGDDERFAMLCANAVRRRMEACFELPATSRTSSEIVSRLPLGAEDKESIGRFLETCDGVKFARRALSEAQRAELMDTAKRLLDIMKRKEAADSA